MRAASSSRRARARPPLSLYFRFLRQFLEGTTKNGQPRTLCPNSRQCAQRRCFGHRRSADGRDTGAGSGRTCIKDLPNLLKKYRKGKQLVFTEEEAAFVQYHFFEPIALRVAAARKISESGPPRRRRTRPPRAAQQCDAPCQVEPLALTTPVEEGRPPSGGVARRARSRASATPGARGSRSGGRPRGRLRLAAPLSTPAPTRTMSQLAFPEPIRSVHAPPSASAATSGREHPLQAQLKRADNRTAKLYEARCQYGSALAMRIQSEDLMAQEVGRLPGLPSSHVMLDTVRGVDETLDHSTILNLPHEAPEAPKVSLHDRAEKLFGIADGPRII